MAGKLFIYDTSDEHNVNQAQGRFTPSDGVTSIATNSINGFRNKLDELVRRGGNVRSRRVPDTWQARGHQI